MDPKSPFTIFDSMRCALNSPSSAFTGRRSPDSSGEFVTSGEVGTPATPSPVTNPWASAAEAERRSFASRRISDEMKSFPSADTV